MDILIVSIYFRMYFMTKDETMFDKYVTSWEKVSNIIKKQQ